MFEHRIVATLTHNATGQCAKCRRYDVPHNPLPQFCEVPDMVVISETEKAAIMQVHWFAGYLERRAALLNRSVIRQPTQGEIS